MFVRTSIRNALAVLVLIGCRTALSLAKTWKKCAKLGHRLKQLDAERRHEMRKSLKNLRYQTEFFAPLFSKPATERFLDRLKMLQDVFGYINDVRMAPRLIEMQKEQNAGVDAARAASYAVGRHEAEAAHVWRTRRCLARTHASAQVLGIECGLVQKSAGSGMELLPALFRNDS